jgi:hypothetical protein
VQTTEIQTTNKILTIPLADYQTGSLIKQHETKICTKHMTNIYMLGMLLYVA